jgi:molybdopterin-guanine dinucleotide biosynthesis protein A
VVVQAPGLIAFVVAGGHSRRMGRDKALLPWGRSTLLDHALERLRQVTPDVRILSGPEPRYAGRGFREHPDVVPDAGALGGVYTGLGEVGDGRGLFLAVDLPLVPVALLARLAELGAGADAVVPVSPGGPEPLCAVYGASCREPIRRRLAAGERKMTAFWPEVRVREVGVDELLAFGDPERLFRNLNRPEDYAALTGP